MIRIIFTDRRVTVQGHAGYGEKGKDVVRAAVSALVYALIATLEETGNIRESVVRPGYATVAAEKEDRAFDVVRGGLGQIAARYPAYVTVEV